MAYMLTAHLTTAICQLSKRPALERFSSYLVTATLLITVIAASLLGSGCIGAAMTAPNNLRSYRSQDRRRYSG